MALIDHKNQQQEVLAIKERYSRRRDISPIKYSPLNPAVYMINQEKERALIKFLKKFDPDKIREMKLLEIGCGGGQNLLQFIKLGFSPSHLMGNDLIDDRVNSARKILPPELKIIAGDATELKYPNNYFDILYQSMVFSSILDNEFQNNLAHKMWALVKPGGGVLWYDFTFDNPFNKDVRGIGFHRIKELFPGNRIKKWRITLAPPISYFVTKFHPSFYSIFNSIPFLRTHLLCWIKKN